ncbi:NACHT, LRR and PYD domains-containing protein 1b allele 2-like isoform X7 [Carassius carassius]|uniref:NACHT, LRR and PYD domains-containing protein 1b allele 2-like isoform X7 n=1 Tax=Carassius carassius TaxID=217509 RepID=UPI00286883EF|nr:NACHT, LRR and PYD domains-containing protein 1b allele 2-like isoform X7 [Carassius carassius]
MQEIQDYLRSGQIGETNLSSSQWSALVYVLLTLEQKMDEFNLKQFIGAHNTADEVLQKLLPVIKESRSVQLRDCGVTDEDCAALASALRSNPSHLRKLNLSGNKLGASGVKLLSDLLKDPRCKLEKLWLRDCGVTDEGCSALASALRSNPSHLRDLDMSFNKLGASGVKLLSDLLKDPRCKLEKLWLRDCGVTDEGCAALTSALRSNPSHLRDLSLSVNKLGESGVKLLSDLLKDPRCKLEKLWLSDCGVTDEGCAALTSALRSNPSHLRELNLSGNKLGASGVKMLSDLLKDPRCKLEKLWLMKCGVTDEGCASLASALRSNPSHLRQLNLSGNKLGASGVKLLSDLKDDPHYKLETLQLSDCGVTDEGCAALASALRSNPSHLRDLDLSANKLGLSGGNLLSDGLKDPHCKLETLWLYDCGVTYEGCAALASALRSNPSHLRELNLTGNKLGEPGVKLLSDLLKDPRCKLETLCLRDCGVTDEGCAALASALRSNPSHLRELNLSFNKLGASGVKLLSHGLKDPRCKLEKLWLYDCGVTDEGCAALASALRSNPSQLRVLNLSANKLGASSVNLLSDLLKDPHSKLKILWLSDCGVTDEGCAALGLALRSNPSHLRELNLTGNKLGPSGVNLFSNLKDDPHYKLETLDHNFQLIQRMLKSNLRKKSECMYEGTAMQRNPTLLNEIYTELYITESESGEINNDHEVRQIETHSRRAATEDTAIKCSEIFRALPGQDKAIRTVMTKGVAGIGKTVSVQKLILDWAEGKENQDVQLIFPLPFREINLMKDKTLSLSDLLHVFFPETKEMELSSNEYKVLFIFDGLDECRLSLDFKSKVKLCNISESVSVDVLLMNLIVGNLLPSALIWITSRPAAADLVPSECVHRVTEVQGFNDPQKEEYFRKRISDQSLADRIISHLKSSRSLYIMCHIPVFCWISAAVLEKMLSRAESGEIPTTLTQMYTHFLILQTNIKHEKDYEKTVKDEDMILKLGKLAFQQLVKGNLTFYEEDLRECGIDETEAAVYLGLCPQIFREESGLFQGKVFYFVHLSIQEHLAALYAHLSFTKNYRNVFDQTEQSLFTNVLNRKKYKSISHLHQRAVDEALRSKNGHLDLFLRFLLGLSLESNQTLLRELLTQTRSGSYNKEETLEFIKQKIRRNHSSERCINLFHCLNELEDNSLMQEIQDYLSSGRIRETKLSSSQWTALVYVLLISEQKMDEFNLRQCIGARNTADEVLQKLLPVIKESRSVQLSDCGVTDEGCASLASALRSNSSHLRKLDLTGNKLGASGVKLLSDVLQNSRCKLEKLRLDVSEPSELNHPLPVCQSCVHIGDSDQWVQVEPSVCTDEGGSVFRISTPAGRFECSRTRLRWVCAGDVTLQYRAVDGRFLSAELERLQCERIGPVIDVTVISGKLEEAHLPHYACLAESDPSLKDDIKVLSVEEEGMFLESVELTRFHAKILQPYFSPKTVLMKLGITVKVHCDLLIFMTNKDPIILHLYFFPVDSVFEEKIKKERKMSNQINLSRPETPLQMNKQHSLEVPGAFVQPKEIKIRGDIKPNFFEVILSVADDIDMTLSRVDDKKSVWTAKVCKALFQTGQKSPQVAVNFDKVTFFDENWSDFIKHIKNVSAIADKLRQKKIIHEELYTEISLPTSTSEASMRKICSAVRKGSDTVKKMFISILLAEEPNLLSHLPSPDS